MLQLITALHLKNSLAMHACWQTLKAIGMWSMHCLKRSHARSTYYHGL
jgi:hypothetical protein